MSNLPTELFSPASLGTFTGLTGATVVVTNAVYKATGWTKAWFGIFVALGLCVGVAAVQQAGPASYFFAILNACLVYLTAAGSSAAVTATTVTTAAGPKAGGLEGMVSGLEAAKKPERRFLSSWF